MAAVWSASAWASGASGAVSRAAWARASRPSTRAPSAMTSGRSVTSTRSMKRMESRKVASASPLPASVTSQSVRPSSRAASAWVMWPWASRSSVSAPPSPGSRPVSTWLDSVVSQLRRSGPVTVTTSRARAQTARPSARAACSRPGSPRWAGTAWSGSSGAEATAPGRFSSGEGRIRRSARRRRRRERRRWRTRPPAQPGRGRSRAGRRGRSRRQRGRGGPRRKWSPRSDRRRPCPEST